MKNIKFNIFIAILITGILFTIIYLLSGFALYLTNIGLLTEENIIFIIIFCLVAMLVFYILQALNIDYP